MPITLRWNDNDKSVIIQEFVGKWSLDEYYESLNLLLGEVREQPHPVHMVADLRKSSALPPGILSVRSFLEKSMLENQGLIVIIGGNALLMTFIDIIRPFAPHFVKSVSFAKSLEAAFEKVAEWEREQTKQPVV